MPVSRRPAGGRPPYHKRPSVRFCVTVAPPASTPDPRAWCSPARRPVRGEDASARAGFDGLVRTGPRIGPGSGCSWAPTRDGLRPHPELALCRAQRPGRWRPGHRRGNRPTSQRASPAGHRKRSPGWSGRWVAGVVGFSVYDVKEFILRIKRLLAESGCHILVRTIPKPADPLTDRRTHFEFAFANIQLQILLYTKQ